jgi:hypothetical protein
VCYKLILPHQENPADGAASYDPLQDSETFAIEQLDRIIMHAYQAPLEMTEKRTKDEDGQRQRSPTRRKRAHRECKQFVNGISMAEEKLFREAMQQEECMFGPPENARKLLKV